MERDKTFKLKALERIKIAEFQIKNDLYFTLGSTLYFALFNFMQFVLGEAPEGKWRHVGINKIFAKYCKENNLIDRDLLKEITKIYGDLYYYRLKSDYMVQKYTKEEIKHLKYIFGFLK